MFIRGFWYNRLSGNHLFTVDENGKTVLGAGDWNCEGVAWYSDDAQGVSVYRLYTPDLRVGDHHFTTDENEYQGLPALGNWRQEDIAWYGVKE